MDPVLGRIAFGCGLVVFLLALIPLPFLERDTPEFVATSLALGLTTLFLVLVSLSIYRAARRRRDDDGK